MEKSISIIIPVYNAAEYLSRTIQSAVTAAARVPGGVEIIAVDNGSGDASQQILAEWEARYPNLMKVMVCPRRGAAAARNYGVSHSRGYWLQFLDADDVLLEDKLVRHLSLADGADWVVGAYRHIYMDGSTEDSIPHPDLWKGLFYDYRTGHTDSNLISRKALAKVGGWDESQPTNEDLELWYQLLKSGVPTKIDTRICSLYIHHPGPRLSQDDKGTLVRRIRTLFAANEWLIENRTSYWRVNASYFMGAILRSIRQLATYDLNAAEAEYNRFARQARRFQSGGPYQLVSQYTRLYPYLGFRNVERLRLALAGVIPEHLKRILKS